MINNIGLYQGPDLPRMIHLGQFALTIQSVGREHPRVGPPALPEVWVTDIQTVPEGEPEQ